MNERRVRSGGVHAAPRTSYVQGPASKLFHACFERPSHCVFGPDGPLYVVDFGQFKIVPEKGGIRMSRDRHRVANPARNEPG